MSILDGIGFALLAAVLAFVLRESKSPLAPFIGILSGIALLLFAVSRLAEGEIFSTLRTLADKTETQIVFKVLAVGLLSEICADTCEELGTPALAKRIVFFGNVEILLLIFPILKELLSLAEEMLI